MGYFASIARHTGLRFFEQHASARSRAAARLDALEPLDVEETVIVPPAAADEPARVDAREPQHAVVHNFTSPPAERRRAADPVPATIAIPRTEAKPAPVRDEHIPMSAPAARSVVTPAATPAGTDAPTPVAGAPPETNRTLLTRVPEPSAQISDQGAELRIETAPAPAPVHYFTRTAELLAAPVPDPVETQTMILREVREWIADGPGHAGAPIEPSALSVPAIVVAGDETPRPALEPGVRRIGTSHHADPAVEPTPDHARIEEQRLELSIGTISVVIEGEERSRPPSQTPPNRPIERPSPPPRRTPRLRRHYL